MATTLIMAQPAPPAAPKRKLVTAGLPSGGRSVKRRASKACQCCRSRKVRCDVVESGIPCTNCRLDEVECCVTEGKRRKKSCIENDMLQDSPIDSTEDREDMSQFPIFDDIDGLQDLSMPAKNSLPQSPSQTLNTLEHERVHHKPHMLYQHHMHRITLDERSRRLSILSSRGMPVQNPAVLTPPFFPSFKLQNELVLPRYIPSIPNRLLAEDTDYLQRKGSFQIPEPCLRNELLRCYVQYVHPYMPILELEEFLGAVNKNDESTTVSLLLFQAVMFAATAYIDMRYLHAQGYDSRKAARKAFFQRVKLLFDFDYETDRVTVVQSVLLMTYWYESPDDPKDVWHWLGVAISLARTIGLNCNTSSSPLSLQKQSLWKRIWWCCYMRDRLVAMGMRRPIRIREEDHDVPMLETSDFETQALAPELNRMLGGCSAVRDPSKRELLAQMCIAVVKCCQFITRVLAAQYSMVGHRLGATQETTMRLVPRKSAADPAEVSSCDGELERWYEALPQELRYFKTTNPREQNVRNDGEVINLHRALLTGVYLTTTSALHRPQMMPAVPNLVIAPELKELSKRRVREAANAITDVFGDLYARGLIRYLPNTGVTILLPAIIVHLLDIKSSDSTTRQLSVRRFQFCMQALQKLRDMYASADFAFSFLDAAIRKADVPIYDNGHQQGSPRGHFHDHGTSTSATGCTHNVKQYERATATTLTPPPELSNMQHIRRSASPTAQDGTFGINPQAMMLSDYQMVANARRESYVALTPPSSDKVPYLSEVAMTGGAAVSLIDMNHMHHSPPTSIHDEIMEVDSADVGGYVEADTLMDFEGVFDSMIDEDAMKNDFEQLINLEEGGSGGVDQLFVDSLADATGKQDEDMDFWGALQPEDTTAAATVGQMQTQELPQEVTMDIEQAERGAKDLRQRIVGVKEASETMEEADKVEEIDSTIAQQE